MRRLILLLKIQILGLFGLNKAFHADKAKAKRSVALFALCVLGVVALCAFYSASVAQGLVSLGLAGSIPFVAVMAGSLAGAVPSFLKTSGLLFSFRDYDLIMSLPVPTGCVVLSRITALYALSLAFSLLVMVPAFAVYAAALGTTAGSVLMMLLALVLAPLVPMAAAILLATAISAAAARMRHANIVTAALMAVFVVACLVVPYAVVGTTGGDIEALSALGTQALGSLGAGYPPAAWAAAGIVSGDVVAFCGFAALSLAAAGTLVAVLSRTFVRVNAALASVKPRSSFSFAAGQGRASAASPFKALLAKEARRLVNTPIYLMNSCIGPLLLVLAAGALAGARALSLLPPGLLAPQLVSLIAPVAPWGVALLLGIASTTTASVSLEGRHRWLMLTAPVPARTVLGAKAALNAIIMGAAVAVAAPVLAVTFGFDAASALAMFFVPLCAVAYVTAVGLALDTERPNFDWQSEYEPVKRSLSVIVTMLGGLAFAAAGIVLTAFFGMGAALVFAATVAAASVTLFVRLTARRLYE